MPAKCLNSTALPSMTGSAASGPMSPRPSTAVPSRDDGDGVAAGGVAAPARDGSAAIASETARRHRGCRAAPGRPGRAGAGWPSSTACRPRAPRTPGRPGRGSAGGAGEQGGRGGHGKSPRRTGAGHQGISFGSRGWWPLRQSRKLPAGADGPTGRARPPRSAGRCDQRRVERPGMAGSRHRRRP